MCTEYIRVFTALVETKGLIKFNFLLPAVGKVLVFRIVRRIFLLARNSKIPEGLNI